MLSIEVNAQFAQAFNLIESSKANVLLFGRAGTGKSTFLNYLRANSKKKLAVLAPTGTAAINVAGVTIHSFFGFTIDITLAKVQRLRNTHRIKKLVRSLDTIIIDEISMVRADLLDCINKFLCLNGPLPLEPFGGIQMVFIGDLYQIPPVVKRELTKYFQEIYQSPYFFSAQSFLTTAQEFTLIEFTKIYRQTEQQFIEILNAIRNNTATSQQLSILNQRLNPNFQAPPNELWLYITGTNQAAQSINATKLQGLAPPEQRYLAKIAGELQPSTFPTDSELVLKIGAQVILVNNDQQGRWVNGTIGTIVNFTYDPNLGADLIGVRLSDGQLVQVEPYEWDLFRYEVDSTTNTITTLKLGSFIQYPLRLAWALTVHKSQGKTFERVVIDLGTTFVPGQLYVALSRCTTLEGLVLKKPVKPTQIFLDPRILNFLANFPIATPKNSTNL